MISCADDKCQITNNKLLKEFMNRPQTDVTEINEWLSTNKLSLNIKKSNDTIFGSCLVNNKVEKMSSKKECILTQNTCRFLFFLFFLLCYRINVFYSYSDIIDFAMFSLVGYVYTYSRIFIFFIYIYIFFSFAVMN